MMNTYFNHGKGRREFLKSLALGTMALSLPGAWGCHTKIHQIKKPKIGLQLWSVRNEIEKDMTGTLDRLAAMGLQYVETAFFPESVSILQAAGLLKERNLKVCSIHCEIPEGEKQSLLPEMAEKYQCDRMVWHGWAEPQDIWEITVGKHKSEEGLIELAGLYNRANAFARSHGLKFFLHNHWWECEPLENGKKPYQVLMENMDQDIYFEIDTYWAKVAGLNPAEVIREIGDRVKLLHIKDGPALSPDDFMVAVGSGSQDFQSIASAAGNAVDFMIIEFDKCETDIFEAIQSSIDYLEKNRIAEK